LIGILLTQKIKIFNACHFFTENELIDVPLTFIVKVFKFKMTSLGERLRQLREESGLPLRKVAAYLDMDQAILSKVERNLRRPTRQQVLSLCAYFKVRPDELMMLWLAEKLIRDLSGEEQALPALKMAQEKLSLNAFRTHEKVRVLEQIISVLREFPAIRKSWVYGAFSRGEDMPGSTIELALEIDRAFTFTENSEMLRRMQSLVNRKVGAGFLDSFKPFILKQIKPDLKLIYEREI
jgi:transcriptional regulator with XRE-family HTH domain